MNTYISIKCVLLTIFLPAMYCFGQNIPTFYSQCGQDSFAYHTFFRNKTNGVFVDIGAHNGIDYSNTYFFEKILNWKGICVEPIPNIYKQLRLNRNCVCIEGCINEKAGAVQFLKVNGNSEDFLTMLSGIVEKFDTRQLQKIASWIGNGRGTFEEIVVKCYKLQDLLAFHNIYHIDYLSLDTNGGELDILKSIDFETITINVIDVENNFHESTFEDFLKTKGYRKLIELAWDNIYVRTAWYDTIEHSC